LFTFNESKQSLSLTTLLEKCGHVGYSFWAEIKHRQTPQYLNAFMREISLYAAVLWRHGWRSLATNVLAEIKFRDNSKTTATLMPGDDANYSCRQYRRRHLMAPQ